MYTVAVLPPPEALGEVEQFRRLHDPAFHRAPPHVALLPPFEPIRRDFIERFDGISHAAFSMCLGAPVAAEMTLGLGITEGEGHVRRLRAAVVDALLDPPAPRPSGAPFLRVGVFGTLPELELARRSLSTVDALPAFRVARVTLLLEDVRGLWHAVRDCELC